MIVTKAVALVDTVETDDPNGAFEVVLSAATLDRDGEVIDSRAFEPLPDHIPFDIDHGMTVATTVGSGTPFYAEDGSLRVKGTFASTALAQEVRTLVAEGHVRTTSVTFMAADRAPDEKGVNHVTSAELLNGTFTPIPSNRESVVLSAKAFHAATTEKAGARNSSSDAATLQEAHDLIVALGAACSMTAADDGEPKKTAPEGEEKAAEIVGAKGPEVVVPFKTLGTDPGAAKAMAAIAAASKTPTEVREDEGAPTDVDAGPEDAKSADIAAEPAAEAADTTAKSTDDDTPLEVRMAVIENAARFAFGG